MKSKLTIDKYGTKNGNFPMAYVIEKMVQLLKLVVLNLGT